MSSVQSSYRHIVSISDYNTIETNMFADSCRKHQCMKLSSLSSLISATTSKLDPNIEGHPLQSSKKLGKDHSHVGLCLRLVASLPNGWMMLKPVDPVPFLERKLSLVNRTGGFRNGDEKLARLGDVKENVTEDKRVPVASNFEVFIKFTA